MSLGQTFQRDLLDLILLNTAIANVGDASGLQPSAAAGTVTVRLHTADPGEAGSPTTNEASYTGYSAQTVVRTSSGWVRSGDTTDNVAAILFGQNTGADQTVTHVSITAGTSKILWSGALSSSLAVTTGVEPSFAIGELNVTLD